jgi:two-component system, cell cycle response regulator
MKKNTLLIVDDEQALAKALNDKFTRLGFIATATYDGKEGLAIALKQHPDIILLDIAMPIMDGLEMLEKLRTDDWGKDARVIMLTNFSDMKKVRESERLGVADYLVKSDWGLEEIVKKVKQILEK